MFICSRFVTSVEQPYVHDLIGISKVYHSKYKDCLDHDDAVIEVSMLAYDQY